MPKTHSFETSTMAYIIFFQKDTSELTKFFLNCHVTDEELLSVFDFKSFVITKLSCEEKTRSSQPKAWFVGKSTTIECICSGKSKNYQNTRTINYHAQ